MKITSRLIRLVSLVALAGLGLTTRSYAKIPEESFVPKGEFSSMYYDLRFYPEAHYDITVSAAISVGGDQTAYASCWFGGFSASSESLWGEVACGIYFHNIHSTRLYDDSSWVADSVEVWEQEAGNGSYIHTYYYDVHVNPTGTTDGYAYCAGQSEKMWGISVITR